MVEIIVPPDEVEKRKQEGWVVFRVEPPGSVGRAWGDGTDQSVDFSGWYRMTRDRE